MPRIQHLAIRSDDPERLARFYEDTFGWSRIASATGGVQMTDGHINIAILDLGGENGIDHFGVKLESMDEVADGLAKTDTKARPKPPGRAAEYGIKDPDGNRIDLSVRGFLGERV
jgi:catechol 2,3-dioxygenase-like lactoylglutathione lyase family enzyme